MQDNPVQTSPDKPRARPLSNMVRSPLTQPHASPSPLPPGKRCTKGAGCVERRRLVSAGGKRVGRSSRPAPWLWTPWWGLAFVPPPVVQKQLDEHRRLAGFCKRSDNVPWSLPADRSSSGRQNGPPSPPTAPPDPTFCSTQRRAR